MDELPKLSRAEYDALPLYPKADYRIAHPLEFCDKASEHEWINLRKIPTGNRIKCLHCQIVWDVDHDLALRIFGTVK